MASATAATATPTASTPITMATPKILNDPRFKAGCKLRTSGRDGAIDIFASLLEEARIKYGEVSIETAPVYAEYGNSLFRESQRHAQAAQLSEQQEEEKLEEALDDQKPEVKEETMNSGDPVAESDAKNSTIKGEEKIEEDNQQQEEIETKGDDEGETENNDDDEEAEVEENNVEEEEDDEHLALAMMETAFAIFDNYVQSSTATAAYLPWVKQESLPRCLTNIGDVLSVLERHADAADAYTRELAWRESNLNFYETEEGKGQSMSLRALVESRKVAEASLLVAEELLSCPSGQDVVTTETQSVLVITSELLSYVTGYYEKARDQLQETVYLMGQIAAKGSVDKTAFQNEKENVCFASALMMSVGEKLAEYEEQQKEQQQAESVGAPAKKKAKK